MPRKIAQKYYKYFIYTNKNVFFIIFICTFAKKALPLQRFLRDIIAILT